MKNAYTNANTFKNLNGGYAENTDINMDLRLIKAFECDQKPGNITQEEYSTWQRKYIFDALKNSVKYGESFCKEFGITDYILCYVLTQEQADSYIRDQYIDPKIIQRATTTV